MKKLKLMIVFLLNSCSTPVVSEKPPVEPIKNVEPIKDEILSQPPLPSTVEQLRLDEENFHTRLFLVELTLKYMEKSLDLKLEEINEAEKIIKASKPQLSDICRIDDYLEVEDFLKIAQEESLLKKNDKLKIALTKLKNNLVEAKKKISEVRKVVKDKKRKIDDKIKIINSLIKEIDNLAPVIFFNAFIAAVYTQDQEKEKKYLKE